MQTPVTKNDTQPITSSNKLHMEPPWQYPATCKTISYSYNTLAQFDEKQITQKRPYK